MTDEERKKLCDKLRVYGKSSFHGGRTCKEAADEIERLEKRLAEAEAALRNTLLHYDVKDVHLFNIVATAS